MTEDIVHEATYPFPPAEVWRALTTREAMAAWLMDSTFEAPVVGHRFEFRDKPKKVLGWDGVSRCEVVEVVPERRLSYRFAIEGDDSTLVTWELEPTPEGTRLRFRHAGFTGFKGWMMRQGMARGWGGMVRHAIPFVVAELREGRVPSRERTTQVRNAGTRAEHHAKARG